MKITNVNQRVTVKKMIISPVTLLSMNRGNFIVHLSFSIKEGAEQGTGSGYSA